MITLTQEMKDKIISDLDLCIDGDVNEEYFTLDYDLAQDVFRMIVDAGEVTLGELFDIDDYTPHALLMDVLSNTVANISECKGAMQDTIYEFMSRIIEPYESEFVQYHRESFAPDACTLAKAAREEGIF